MHTSVISPDRKRYRGPNKQPVPGPSLGAHMCFAVYHGEDNDEREKLLSAVMAEYATVGNPRQRATLAVHGWAIGKAKPSYKWRVVLAPWVPMENWDVAAEVAS